MKTMSANRNTGSISLFPNRFLAGAVIGTAGALIYSNMALKQQIILLQEGAMEESDELAWRAYSSGSPEVGKWAMSNYLNKVVEVYSVRPAKGRQYFYFIFKGHARLARLGRDSHDTNLESAQFALALDSLKKWSVEASPGSNYVFESLEKIDQAERAARNNQ